MSDGMMTEGLAEERDPQCQEQVVIGGERIRCQRPEGHEERDEGHRHKAVFAREGWAHIAVVWGEA